MDIGDDFDRALLHKANGKLTDALERISELEKIAEERKATIDAISAENGRLKRKIKRALNKAK